MSGNPFTQCTALRCNTAYLVQAYGRDLMEAQEWCRKYMRSGNVKDLTQAWDLYYHVFRRISKQLPQVSQRDPQDTSAYISDSYAIILVFGEFFGGTFVDR